MDSKTRTVSPGPRDRTVRTSGGEVLQIPAGWVLLPPGDPGATRRFKAAGPTWTVEQRRGRKTFSLGVWGPAQTLTRIQEELKVERAQPEYAKRRAADSARRERKQEAYVEDFRGAVLAFLAFDSPHLELAERLADAVTAHATPVGSGTVARTQRIPIERRAESAVIAWMRHQTTAYDSLRIPRVKGARREVRQQLAQQSRLILARYRMGNRQVAQGACPLAIALKQPISSLPTEQAVSKKSAIALRADRAPSSPVNAAKSLHSGDRKIERQRVSKSKDDRTVAAPRRIRKTDLD